MNIDEVLSNMLNGDPLHDSIVIGIMFVCFWTFFNAIFTGLFSIFRR